MHYINPEEIKSEIQKLGHTVANIWNIAQCANCQRYGYTKNYCHIKLDAPNAQVTT
jgi:hypothetical protein